MFTLAASIPVPSPKMPAPSVTAFGLPRLSARWPAKKEARAAGIKMEETIRPWIVDEKSPKVRLKDGIAVMGPIVPVSRLHLVGH